MDGDAEASWSAIELEPDDRLGTFVVVVVAADVGGGETTGGRALAMDPSTRGDGGGADDELALFSAKGTGRLDMDGDRLRATGTKGAGAGPGSPPSAGTGTGRGTTRPEKEFRRAG